MFRFSRIWWVGAVAVYLASGCGGSGRPEIAPVVGAVTLDGAPLPNATVVFTPQTPGMKPSRGITDAAGRFELTYLRDIKGAVLGNHEVRVTTRTEHRPVEKVPAKYNSRSELTVEVPSGGKNFDFALTTK